MRRLLHSLATTKGYFALHAEPASHLVYDLLFDVFTSANKVATPEVFLKAYPRLLAMGDGEITTGGYAPDFITDWLNERVASGAFVTRQNQLVISDAHRESMQKQFAALTAI